MIEWSAETASFLTSLAQHKAQLQGAPVLLKGSVEAAGEGGWARSSSQVRRRTVVCRDSEFLDFSGTPGVCGSEGICCVAPGPPVSTKRFCE